MFQRSPSRISNFAQALVRIWSQEHCAYWRRTADGLSAGNGYTGSKEGAAILPLPDAFMLVRHCGPEKDLWFEFVGQGEARLRAALAGAVAACIPHLSPIRMILHCPKCGLQHIDEPDERTPNWTNPPHRSHLCHGCGCIWRPADIPTDGVRSLETAGKADNWKPGDPTVGGAPA